MEIFSNRELALLIWIVIIVITIVVVPKSSQIKESIKALFAAFFQAQIQLVLVSMLNYVLSIIYLLVKLGMWDFSDLKDTVFWLFSVAFLSVFEIQKIQKDRKFLKHLVLNNLKLIAILEFLVGVYSFSLLTELILLPILTSIGILTAFSEGDEKYYPVRRFLNNLSLLFSLFLIGYAIYRIIVNVKSFFSTETLYDFTISPLLTLLYIPFLFFLMIYSTYEQVLVRLKFSIKDRKKRIFARVSAMILFNLRIGLLERWSSTLYRESHNSYEEIWSSMKDILKLASIEKNPPKIEKSKGWSPYIAKEVLKSFDLKTGWYKESYGEWYACSNYKDLDKDILSNNIAYYVEGEKQVAKSLKLVLNVYNVEKASEAYKTFFNTGKTLYEFATGKDTPQTLGNYLLTGIETDKVEGIHHIQILKEDFKNSKVGGYEVKFVISMAKTVS
ncbi:hypothetical protein [uncultured Croceitalea sp.]|uniref:hypothetical protein n=1 Tax=uncultured Croceitalea sp. TaxID=1798908 RepID=UPI00374FA36C